jgi:predicted 3-demethylubiquinone-9 3-methyltransferase (glyoxalase superfamily)
MNPIHKISTNLWFDHNAEEAVKFYTSIFRNSEILSITHYGKEGYDIHHMEAGTVMTIEFLLEGYKFIALNAGPAFKFNEAISLVVTCSSQQEIDYYWEKLSQGGDPTAQQCGWLKDKFGVSWQVVPQQLSEMYQDKDQEKTERVMKAMMQMKKLDLNQLEEAYEGEVMAEQGQA